MGALCDTLDLKSVLWLAFGIVLHSKGRGVSHARWKTMPHFKYVNFCSLADFLVIDWLFWIFVLGSFWPISRLAWIILPVYKFEIWRTNWVYCLPWCFLSNWENSTQNENDKVNLVSLSSCTNRLPIWHLFASYFFKLFAYLSKFLGFNFVQAVQGIYGESFGVSHLLFPADRTLARSGQNFFKGD